MKPALCIFFALTSFFVQGASEGVETNQQRSDRLLRQLNSELNIKAQQAAATEIHGGREMGTLFMPRLRAILEGHSVEDVQPVLMALREVRDLASTDVAYLFQKISWGIANIDQDAKNAGMLANHGPLILANFPKADHELIIATLLENRHDKRLPLQEMAVTALKKSGTSISLPALRSLAERIKPKPGEVNRLYDLVVETTAVVAARASSPADGQVPQPASSPTHSPNNPPSEKFTLPTEQAQDSTLWPIVFVLIVAAGGLLWLLLKGRK